MLCVHRFVNFKEGFVQKKITAVRTFIAPENVSVESLLRENAKKKSPSSTNFQGLCYKLEYP